MNTAIICFTLTGLRTAEMIKTALTSSENMEVSIDVKSRYLENSIPESIGEWTGRQFESREAVIFVGAVGIAVRSIAPYVVSKKKDPAVLVVDECGNFVISLLSGHLGGANDLAMQVAKGIRAVPVVTTATDLHGKFAVDVFARKNNCAIFPMKAAKEASSALLAGEEIGFYSEFSYEGNLPDGLILCDAEGNPMMPHQKKKPRTGVAVTVFNSRKPFEETVFVVPKVLALGIGCRKGKEAAAVKKAAEECLKRAACYKEAVFALASIDLKKEESGILSLAEEWRVPFLTYTEEALRAVPGEFTPSVFVKQITGVDNVCERSAVLASESGTLLQRKVGAEGVTTALAVKEGGIKF